MGVVHGSKSLVRLAQRLAPHQIAQVAPSQQSEASRHDAGIDVEPLHGFAVAGDVARRQKPEGPLQAEQAQRNEQMDGRVAPEVVRPEVADEQACERRPLHAGDLGVAQGSVQLGAVTWFSSWLLVVAALWQLHRAGSTGLRWVVDWGR
jgi:hypothetical protein